MGYTCVKPMKIQVGPGKVEMRQPGQPVPEAETWANPGLWITRGFIRPDDHETALASGYTRDKLVPMRPATETDVQRGLNSPAPKAGKPLPGADTGLLNDTGGDAGDDAGGADQSPDEGDTESELMKMNRPDLDTFASEHTTVQNPSGFANKRDLAAAILQSAGE